MKLRIFVEEDNERNEVLSVEQAAKLIGRSTPSVYNYLHDKTIKTIRLDKLYIYKSSFLAAMKNNNIRIKTELL